VLGPVLVKAQDQRDQYVSSYKQIVTEVANVVDGSTYNGQTLLGATSGAVPPTSLTVINNENGATSTLSAEDTSGLASTLAGLIGATFSRTAAGADTFTAAAAGADQTAASTALTTTSGATSFQAAQTLAREQSPDQHHVGTIGNNKICRKQGLAVLRIRRKSAQRRRRRNYQQSSLQHSVHRLLRIARKKTNPQNAAHSAVFKICVQFSFFEHSA